MSVQTDDEAVGKRCDLVIVADSGHGTTCRNDVFEVIKKSEYFFCFERILIFILDAGDFVRDTPVHVFGRYFINMLAQTTGLSVHCYLSGKLGGVQQITSRVACDEVDLVLFFRDPLKVDASSLNEQNLLRLCDMHGVPIATNIATAEVLLRGLDQGDLDYREGMHPPVVEPVPVLEHRAVC